MSSLARLVSIHKVTDGIVVVGDCLQKHGGVYPVFHYFHFYWRRHALTVVAVPSTDET